MTTRTLAIRNWPLLFALLLSLGAPWASEAQTVPANWGRYNGKLFSFSYPPSWKVTPVNDSYVQLSVPNSPFLTMEIEHTTAYSNTQTALAAERLDLQNVAKQLRLNITFDLPAPGRRGGTSIYAALDNRSLIVLDASVNVIAIGKSMYIIRMSTTAADQYQNIQQFRQPLEDSIIFHFPPASVEGTWTTGVGDDSAFNGAAATPRRWDAALTLTADGHYMYVVEQSKTPVWELRVVGTWAVTDPSPIKSENSGQITLMPTTSQMTGTVDRNYELSRLGYEGFPVDSTESLAISTGGQGGIDLTKLSNSGSRHYDLSTLAPPPAGTLRITDAAAFSTGPVAQGSLISLFGNFGVTQTSATSLPLPTSLSQLSVTVAGRLSPLLFVGASQVNLQLPFETPEGNAQVVVSVRGGAILSGTVAVTRTAPKLFSSDGKHAVVLNEDYTLNSSTNPAKAGSYLIAYITGQGALRTPVASGAAAPSSPPAVTAATTTAMIGGKPANVAFSGGAPGFAGVAQVNVQVPGGLANAVPLTVTVGGAESNALVIYIAP